MGNEGFEGVFPGLFLRAYRLALGILSNRQAAEDVAAEALARTYAAWPRVGDLPFRDGWVLRVTANLALDVLRRKAPQADPLIRDNPGDVAVLRLTVREELQRLPKRQRQVMILRHFGELSELEIAKVLEISPGAVKSHAHRAARALRARLGEQAEEVIVHAD
jgi:RNA polymerase sigma factor (sigma-70 family)